MGSIDSIDDRTFMVNFTVDGVAKLRDRVKDKLKEYMGDYTDDTLVEYVIVLLRNGRQKDESRNELNVFLGDDSDSFISWLWDHLASHLDAYVRPQDEVSKPKSHPAQSGRNASLNLESEPDRRKSNYESRSRHNREWKGPVRDAAEPLCFRSSEIEHMHLDAKGHHDMSHARRSLSPLSAAHRKRNWEQPSAKRETSQININAPRRLLQFAVRDAVATSRSIDSSAEPPLKRLHLAVSTASGESTLVGRPRRIQSVARVPNPMATVIKAVAEAAEDVTRFRSSGGVFDRLGRGIDVSETSDQLALFREASAKDSEYEDANQIHERMRLAYIQPDDQSKAYVGNTSLLETETGLASDSISENEGVDEINAFGRRVTDATQLATTVGNKTEYSVMSQYSLAKNADEVRPGATTNASHRIVNISVHVNAWKPPHYQELREVVEVDGLKSVQERESRASKSCVEVMENSVIAISNGNAKPGSDSQNESQKTHLSLTGHYAAGRPLEDADSRTLFIGNVHFAATKDSLCRHFNKFGEVLKVFIVTDATTRQPIGSAYVEFMRKEAADTALSLDGTSFMSRILKVVRSSAAKKEAASTMTWPTIARGATFSTIGYPGPFARGFPSAFSPPPPIKIGARSLQWKRDSQLSSVAISTSLPGNSVSSHTARSFTYVRTETKPEGNSSTN